MLKKTFGSTDIQVSRLGLGTVKFGRNTGVKYPSGFELPSDAEIKNIIELSYDLGINLIDTAPAYGISEERLGPALKGQRDRWILSSKLGEEYENDQSSFNFTPEHARFSIERSLKRLQTNHIDIMMVHSDGNDIDVINNYGLLEALAEFKKEGLIRAFGVSTKTVEGGLLALEKSDCAMVTYNLNHTEEETVLDRAAKLNKGTFIKKALASGHLCNSAEHRDPVLASMEFILKHPGVSSIILGTINPAHLKHNAEACLQALKNLGIHS